LVRAIVFEAAYARVYGKHDNYMGEFNARPYRFQNLAFRGAQVELEELVEVQS
jgi:hypothetical protein